MNRLFKEAREQFQRLSADAKRRRLESEAVNFRLQQEQQELDVRSKKIEEELKKRRKSGYETVKNRAPNILREINQEVLNGSGKIEDWRRHYKKYDAHLEIHPDQMRLGVPSVRTVIEDWDITKLEYQVDQELS